jgi:hypothetical protein
MSRVWTLNLMGRMPPAEILVRPQTNQLDEKLKEENKCEKQIGGLERSLVGRASEAHPFHGCKHVQ